MYGNVKLIGEYFVLLSTLDTVQIFDKWFFLAYVGSVLAGFHRLNLYFYAWSKENPLKKHAVPLGRIQSFWFDENLYYKDCMNTETFKVIELLSLGASPPDL